MGIFLPHGRYSRGDGETNLRRGIFSAMLFPNKAALILVLLLAGGAVYDWVIYDGEHLLFLARKAVDLLDTLAFWR